MATLLALLCSFGLAFPALSSAEVLCVNKTGPQCSQTFPADQIQAAFMFAGLSQLSHDKIEIGPGVYPNGPFNAANNIEIEGAGIDETILTHETPLGINSILLLANFGEPQIRDLTIRVGEGDVGNRGLQIASGTVERVKVEALPNSSPSPAVDAFGVTARQLEVSAPPNVLAVSGGGLIEDAVISGGTALSWNYGTARRLRLTGNVGALMQGESRLENSLITTAGPDAIGVGVPEHGGDTAALSHLTVVGDGSPGGVGLRMVKTANTFGSILASAEIRNTVVTGYPVALRRKGHPGSAEPGCSPNCQIAQETSVAWSLLNGAIEDQGGPGSLTMGSGVLRNLGPGLMNTAAGNFRPRFDSPLVDAGEPGALGQGSFNLNESPLTVDGMARIVAGKGAGTPRRDIGAFEYGRRPPTARLTAPNRRVLLYRPASFVIAANDPDGDPLSYELNLNERVRHGKMGGATQRVRHAFLSPGVKQVKLTITDPTGLAAVSSAKVRVLAKKGRCANRRVGGADRDRFNGSPAGDDLRGRGGRDILRGGRGSDCLNGGIGKDVLNGGPGRDRLTGGPGADRIIGGPLGRFLWKAARNRGFIGSLNLPVVPG